MSIFAILLVALGGAGLMYLFDPEGGRKRREQVREQASKVLNRAQENVGELAKDVKNRTQEVVSKATDRVEKEIEKH